MQLYYRRSWLVALGMFTVFAGGTMLSAQSPDEDDDAPLVGEQIDLKQVKKRPKPIKQGAPIFPMGMSRAGVEGKVAVEFIIDTTGKVRNPHVVQSNNPWFERSAIDAILGWKFEPGESDGKKVNVRVRQLMEFNLPGRGQPLWQVSKGKDHAKQPVEFQWHTPPAPTNTTVPVYPTTLLQANTAGKATVVYVIGTDGRVLATKLIEATAPEFGYAALATLDAWRFEPAKKKDGSPSYARMSMTYEFKPNGHGDVPVTTGTKDVLAALKKKPELIASPGDLDKPLAPISRRPPVYPTAFLNEGTEGSAVIEFYIDRNGDAQLPSIVSSTAPEFGYAAMQAVATWRFESPRRDGKKVIVKARVSVNFSPEEPKGGSREAKVKQP